MSASNEVALIYTTFPSPEEAKSVSRQIVEGKLAACANIIPQMLSIYEWEGKLEEASEVVVLYKTTRANCNSLVARVTELHSYDIPAVLICDISGGNGEFLNWISQQTRS
ncbi:MAG: divalent-cation tolerance protein CutA [Methyloligellaceae bacterium]